NQGPRGTPCSPSHFLLLSDDGPTDTGRAAPNLRPSAHQTLIVAFFSRIKAMNLAADRGLSIHERGGCTETTDWSGMRRLNQVADGVWVRQSEWVWTNSIVVRGEDGLILIDPGIHGSELEGLADDLDGLDAPVVAGFSTHPHTDHLLWHSR